MSDMDDTYNPDEDTYSGDPTLDVVLMTAPDQAYCRQCGGDIVTDDGSGWRHIQTWITDHAPQLE
jgi:hypothetical protein